MNFVKNSSGLTIFMCIVLEYWRVTDRRTDRRTGGIAIHISRDTFVNECGLHRHNCHC